MPYEESPRRSRTGANGEEDGTNYPDAAPGCGVQKPSLLRKLSGGAMAAGRDAASCPAGPIDGACRPEPVKRHLSVRAEAVEAKRSTKRVVLSRDQSAVSRRLKEEQRTWAMTAPPLGSRKLSRAQLLDRKMSVEINKLGLEDRHSSFPLLDRMTTEDVLASLIDDEDEQQEQLLNGSGPSLPLGSSLLLAASPPERLGSENRMTTIDAIAIGIANGNQQSSGEWDDALDLINESTVAPAVLEGESVGVNADIAEKWLKGET